MLFLQKKRSLLKQVPLKQEKDVQKTSVSFSNFCTNDCSQKRSALDCWAIETTKIAGAIEAAKIGDDGKDSEYLGTNLAKILCI